MKTWVIKVGKIIIGRVKQFGPTDFSAQRSWRDSKSEWYGKAKTFDEAQAVIFERLYSDCETLAQYRASIQQYGTTSEEEQ